MGLIVAQGITDPSTGASLAGHYARVSECRVEIASRSALLIVQTYSSYQARIAGLAPVDSTQVSVEDTHLGSTYTETFGSEPGVVTPEPTAANVLWTQSYHALRSHPVMATLFAGAVNA